MPALRAGGTSVTDRGFVCGRATTVAHQSVASPARLWFLPTAMGEAGKLELLAQRPNLYLARLGAVLLQSYRHRVTLDDVLTGHHVTARLTSRPGGVKRAESLHFCCPIR